MKYKIKITQQAETDIRNIYEYISFCLKSPEIAKGQIKRIKDRIFGLDEMPQRFKVYELDPWSERGLRSMIVDNYLVFYIADSSTKTVTVIRVIYSSRDINTQLSE